MAINENEINNEINWAAYYAAASEVERAAHALREALLRQHWAACHIANAFNFNNESEPARATMRKFYAVERRSWSAQADKLIAASKRAGDQASVAARLVAEWRKTCKLIGEPVGW
ncbi:MAG: hypothetical protein EBX50_21800 [Chitinophagia bacterium]|nr:hypothetical protein [Chitinophagia bacterium]